MGEWAKLLFGRESFQDVGLIVAGSTPNAPELDALERNFNIVGSNTDRLGKMIKTIGFNYGSWYDQRGNGSTYYEISGYGCLEKRIKLVNPKNFVHTTKYFLWKRDNFYIIDTSLSTRLKALNLNTDLLTFRNG